MRRLRLRPEDVLVGLAVVLVALQAVLIGSIVLEALTTPGLFP